ncbi:MAG: TerB family tellurite resistance protein [Paludibacteraceae bacterium]|nr:TerB family tellurite resistance protein [Paludibacteraceae bacterium]
MKTKIEDIATIVAVAVWADGEFAEAEKIVVAEVAKAIDTDEKKFVSTIEKLSKEIEGKDEEAINALLEKAADNVDDEEVAGILEIAIQVLLSDGVLSYDEVSNLLAIAEALGVDEADAVLMLADAVKDEEDIEIDMD